MVPGVPIIYNIKHSGRSSYYHMPEKSSRPRIENVSTVAELVQWYWLKSELVSFARQSGVAYNCGKPELLSRLCHWLETGEKVVKKKPPIRSKFDWTKETLTLETVITDSYRNTQNMRLFMRSHAAEHFTFSNEFMAWMRSAQGKTLRTAVAFWLDLDARKKRDGYREKPLPQNQYNQFSRDISVAAPGISAKDIRRIWAIKRARPAPHLYQKGDEHL